MPPRRSPPAATSSGACTGYRRGVQLHKTTRGMTAVQAGLHGLQMLLSALRALIVTVADGVGAPVAVWVGSGVLPTRLGTWTTYGLPAPRVTWMTLPAVSSFTKVAPGKAAATVRASWKYGLE